MISVIICTYNRERYIAQALERVSKTEFADYEILVVNNNSTDSSEAKIQAFMEANPAVPVRYFVETKQGLSNARNRGMAEARGDVFVFLDDDSLVQGDYLRTLDEYLTMNPQADAFGGRIEPLFDECPRPKWLCRWSMGWVSALDMGEAVREFEGKAFPIGANMGIRRAMAEKVGPFNPELGRKGGNMDAGEEKDMFRRIRAAGGTIWYFPGLRVQHVIPAKRTTLEYVRRFADGVGISERRRTKADGTYLRRVAAEFVKWCGTLVLFVWYLITFRPVCGATLVRFRWHVTRRLLSSER
ncbi:MAG: glycosyltransferase family 2 protein [Bacteroidales bacterium]|nr:glycosyltransferase family 2 protein [Bacteroidales bacterium]